MSTEIQHPSPECPCAECRQAAGHDMRKGMLAAATHDPQSITVDLGAVCGSLFQIRANGAMLAIGEGARGFQLCRPSMVFPQRENGEGQRGRIDLPPIARAEMVFQLRDLAAILSDVAGSVDSGLSPIAAVVAIAAARQGPTGDFAPPVRSRGDRPQGGRSPSDAGRPSGGGGAKDVGRDEWAAVRARLIEEREAAAKASAEGEASRAAIVAELEAGVARRDEEVRGLRAELETARQAAPVIDPGRLAEIAVEGWRAWMESRSLTLDLREVILAGFLDQGPWRASARVTAPSRESTGWVDSPAAGPVRGS